MNRAAYDAALSGAIVVDRSDHALVRVHGRDPLRMVHGLVSNDVRSLRPGRAVYSTLLTPKGRMLADPRIVRRADDLLLEADAGAVPNILDTFKRSVPPLFARAEGMEDRLAVVGVYGPASTEIVARTVGVAQPAVSGDVSHTTSPAGGEPDAVPSPAAVRERDASASPSPAGGELDAVPRPLAVPEGDASASRSPAGGEPDAVPSPAAVREGDASASRSPAGGELDAASMLGAIPVDDGAAASFAGEEVIVLRTDRAGVAGWEIVVASERKHALRSALERAGAVPGDLGTLEVLRVEAGRPRWGAELTGDVIPLEAGLKDRAISTTKGCYTGQEVIVRILHRGHVNRHLRGIRFDNGGAVVGDELFHPEIRAGKPLGSITSAVASPRLGPIALAYIRREVEPGTTVHVGAPDGPAGTVVDLPFRLPD